MFEELLELYKSKAADTERKLKEEQSMIAMIMAVEHMSEMLSAKQRDVELLGRLIDQVDRLSKEVADLKSQLKARQGRASSQSQTSGNGTESRALDTHANTLIELMSERPGRYSTSDLVEMLGLNKTTVISVMKRAVDLDPRHIKLTQGKRRKLTLSFTPDESVEGEIMESSQDGDEDRVRLELMAMT
ncbi:MAG: hypothetical protein JW986_01265 [Methanotrichaceae archaeon]|nr:hypothetical protein [Methanotrichaceae archaeon]